MTTPHECINTQPNSPKSKLKGQTTLKPARSSRGLSPQPATARHSAAKNTHASCRDVWCGSHTRPPTDQDHSPLHASTLCAWTAECIARPVGPAHRMQHTTTQYKRRYTCTSLSASCILHWGFGMIPTPLNPQPYIRPQHSARLLSLHTQPHTHPRRNE
jgi:hypothetical protein